MSTPKNKLMSTIHKSSHGYVLSKLHISELSGISTELLNSLNFGIVETMILQVCDQCILTKTKWILAKELELNGLIQRNLMENSMTSEEYKEEESIILEKEDGTNTMIIPGQQLLKDPKIIEIERNVSKNVSIFSRLLWRYNIMNDLMKIRSNHNNLHLNGDSIAWKRNSFTSIRRTIIFLFSQKKKFLPLNFNIERFQLNGIEHFVGGLAREKSVINPILLTANQVRTSQTVPDRATTIPSNSSTISATRPPLQGPGHETGSHDVIRGENKHLPVIIDGSRSQQRLARPWGRAQVGFIETEIYESMSPLTHETQQKF